MGRNWKLYRPVRSLSTLLVTPVAMFVTLTFASFTTAPVGSVTIPRTAPVMVWADAPSVLPDRRRKPNASKRLKAKRDRLSPRSTERNLCTVIVLSQIPEAWNAEGTVSGSHDGGWAFYRSFTVKPRSASSYATCCAHVTVMNRRSIRWSRLRSCSVDVRKGRHATRG